MESASSVMYSSKKNDCNNECSTNDIIDPVVENQSVTLGSEPSEAICLSNDRKSSMGALTNFEIPESIQALDDILLEFEEPESLPPNIGSSLPESHSEDDGYMSLNGRRCDVNSMHSQQISPNSTSLEESQKMHKTSKDIAKHHDFAEDISCAKNASAQIIQSTLPKTKSKGCTKSNYSSLPCSSLRSNLLENNTRVGSCSGERNILGIDISAVHNAVLRGGVAKLPEPIVNEHPVTIYPGRKSPNWSIRSPRSALCPVQSQDNCKENKQNNLNTHLLAIMKKTKASDVASKERDNENGSEEKQCGAYDFEELKSSEKLSNDTKDKEYSLIISAPATPQKTNSIAWEINFNKTTKTDLPKLKKKTKDNSFKYKGLDKLSNTNPKGGVGKVCENPSSKKAYKHCANNNLKSHNGKFINDSSETNDPLVIYDFDDNTNNYSKAYDSMLGKGTFIIRKRQGQNSMNLTKPKILTYQHLNGDTDTNNKGYGGNCVTSPVHKGSIKNLTRVRLSLDLEARHLESSTEKQLDTYKSQLVEDCLSNTFDKEEEDDFCNKDNNKTQGYSLTSSNNVGYDHSKGLPQKVERICSGFSPTSPDVSRKSNELYLKGDKSASKSILLTHNQALNKVSSDLRSPGATEQISNCTTPHRELAPPLEEEEEQCSESQSGCAPLQQIEHNISALLRGDIAVVRIGDPSQSRRSLNYRPGVHKSESAKEMLLSQTAFGPLPPSPLASSPEINGCDSLPPLPPSPSGTDIEDNILDTESVFVPTEIHPTRSKRESFEVNTKKGAPKYHLNDAPLPPLPYENLPPAVPPHRGSTHFQTLRSRSIDSNYVRKCPMAIPHSGSSVISTGNNASVGDTAFTSRRNIGSYGNKRSVRQSPREEHRLQTSCSLPETPIFSRGCDIARTPYRRQTENTVGSGSRTAPRSNAAQASNMGSSIVGISGGSTLGVGICRQRSITHVLASGEMLRLSGGPARGWYPKHRSMRPASTENIDRLAISHSASMRVWDSAGGITGTGQIRKPLTLPPNLTPSFLNKSPREALRRVTSLLINKKAASKEREGKISKENVSQPSMASSRGTGTACQTALQESSSRSCNQKSHKKKGFFKQFWKKSKHYSLEQ